MLISCLFSIVSAVIFVIKITIEFVSFVFNNIFLAIAIREGVKSAALSDRLFGRALIS